MRSGLRDVSAALTLGIGFIISAIPASAMACAVCVGSSPADRGYFWGILFLMAMPFTVGGAIGGWLVYTYWRGHRDRFTTSAARMPSRNAIRQLLARRGAARRDDEPRMPLKQPLGSTAEVSTSKWKEGAN
jgi:hypothetical protein